MRATVQRHWRESVEGYQAGFQIQADRGRCQSTTRLPRARSRANTRQTV